MTVCPVCSERFEKRDYKALSEHFISYASRSDVDHIRWLNHNITKCADMEGMNLPIMNC
jgi:hypothetical protein